MLSAERKRYIMSRLEEEGSLQVKRVAEELDISETTIRRDLMELEEDGKLTRVYGGALLKNFESILTSDKETTMKERLGLYYEEKALLCSKANEMIQDGECIFLDGGTTLVPMIDLVANRKIKIVTHNHLLMERVKNPTAEIIFIGGSFNSFYHMSIGPIAEDTLSMYNFDRCFLSCAGIDFSQKMSYTAEMETRQMKVIAMEHSQHSYLLLNEDKINVKGFCQFTPLSNFDKIFIRMNMEIANLPKNVEIIK